MRMVESGEEVGDERVGLGGGLDLVEGGGEEEWVVSGDGGGEWMVDGGK